MITFKNIKYKNFLSSGNQFTSISLNSHPTTVIMGFNASGKSTILDALCFALFNRPFRNITKGQIVNSVNGKHCVVELEFSIGTNEFKIVRGIKPMIFEIHMNGVLLDQDAASRDYQEFLESNILKINYKSFTQIVILGSATFTPFMQLPTAQRREIIEDLLDIKIFSSMNIVVKEKLSNIKADITAASSGIELLESKISSQKRLIDKLSENNDDKKAELNSNIDNANLRIDAHNNNIIDINKWIENNRIDKDKEKLAKDKLEKCRNKRVENLHTIKLLKTEVSFFENNVVCPTCKQDISEENREEHLSKHNDKISKLQEENDKIEPLIGRLESGISKIDNIKIDILKKENKIKSLKDSIASENRMINSWKSELDKLDRISSDIHKEEDILKAYKSDLLEEVDSYNSLKNDKQYLDTCLNLLKDSGIKTTIVERYLPVINKLINKFLHQMDMFVQFELNEKFEETIKSRYRDTFSYASFSEGQKARINLAILFTWREIGRLRNSTNTNLLLMDEVFDGSLDEEGTDFVMKYLTEESIKTNIFVITHKDSLFDKFHNLIRFKTVGNYGVIDE